MTDIWFYDDFPGGSAQTFSKRLAWKAAPHSIAVHTTEGSSYPSYNGDGSSAPHATIDIWNFTFRQHYGLDVAGWALKAPSGTSTNTQGVVQFEIIGTCNPANAALAGMFVPTAPDRNLQYAATIIRGVADRLGISWSSSLLFAPYPASYGTGAAQRLSDSQFRSYNGLLGHQHVPYNDHGDPGSFPIDRFLSLGGLPPSPITPYPQEEDDMRPMFVRRNDGLIASIGENGAVALTAAEWQVWTNLGYFVPPAFANMDPGPFDAIIRSLGGWQPGEV